MHCLQCLSLSFWQLRNLIFYALLVSKRWTYILKSLLNPLQIVFPSSISSFTTVFLLKNVIGFQCWGTSITIFANISHCEFHSVYFMKYKLGLFSWRKSLDHYFLRHARCYWKNILIFLTEERYVFPSAPDYYAKGIIMLKYHTSEVTSMP